VKYSPSHDWIRLDNNIATIGITAFIKNELGDMVHVELPSIGRFVRAGEEVCVLESIKSATGFYSPVSGKIIAVNTALKKSLDAINCDAENEGWLIQIEMSNPKELDSFLSKSEYSQLVGGSQPPPSAL
jgi:glycine cleavage system H protein